MAGVYGKYVPQIINRAKIVEIINCLLYIFLLDKNLNPLNIKSTRAIMVKNGSIVKVITLPKWILKCPESKLDAWYLTFGNVRGNIKVK